MITDILQAYHRPQVTHAPALADYPVGYSDALKLPLALTWILETTPNATHDTLYHQVRVDVFTAHVGKSKFNLNKVQAQDLREVFTAMYSLAGLNLVFSSMPYLRLIDGSVRLTGFRDLIESPDGTLMHGFVVVFEMSSRISQIQCPPVPLPSYILPAGSGTSTGGGGSSPSGGGGAVTAHDHTLASLTDVTLTLPADQQQLVFSSASNVWVNQDSPVIPASLVDLSDVSFPSPLLEDQALLYDPVSGQFINQPLPPDLGGLLYLAKTYL